MNARQFNGHATRRQRSLAPPAPFRCFRPAFRSQLECLRQLNLGRKTQKRVIRQPASYRVGDRNFVNIPRLSSAKKLPRFTAAFLRKASESEDRSGSDPRSDRVAAWQE